MLTPLATMASTWLYVGYCVACWWSLVAMFTASWMKGSSSALSTVLRLEVVEAATGREGMDSISTGAMMKVKRWLSEQGRVLLQGRRVKAVAGG